MRPLTLAVLIAAAGLAACQPAADTATTQGVAAEALASQAVHPLRIGQLQAWSLRDGEIVLPTEAGVIPWSDPAQVREALVAAGLDGDAVHLSVQPLLVRDGDHLVLLDAGAGGQMGTANLLPSSLREAGVEPAAITDILISHAHGDHVGGLVTAAGGLTFPNAKIRMSAPEWAALQADAEQQALVSTIRPRVEAFEPGARVTPSILAVPLAGHTAGHCGYEIASGEERLLYFGDALHSSILSVQHPQWTNAWDIDPAAGAATRTLLMTDAADESLIVYGVHFPWPGVGRFVRQGDGFVWTPEPGGAQ